MKGNILSTKIWYVAFYGQMVFSKLMVLDHFGGRTLNLPLSPTPKQIEENRSVLSILADSNDVELILITSEDIAYLPNFEREALTKKLT